MNKRYIIGAVVAVIALWVILSLGHKSVVAPAIPVPTQSEQLSATTTSPAVVETKTTATTQRTTTVSTPKTTTSTYYTPAMTKDGSYIVSYTNSGFVPKTLTIQKGRSVHFVNNSSKAMSITTTTTQNQVQLELNQGKTVGFGGTYDFTFLSSGTWVYMNRNVQTDYASIIVE